MSAVHHHVLEAARGEYLDQLAEAHEYRDGLLRVAVKVALHRRLHRTQILVLQPAQHHKPAAIFDEGAHDGGKVSCLNGRNVAQIPGHSHVLNRDPP